MDERFLISTNYKLLLFIRNNKWIISAPNASLTSACYCTQEHGLRTHPETPLLNKTTSLYLKKNTSEQPEKPEKSHISLSLYLKSRKKYIIRNVDKKPSPLCLVISFRCLDPSSIMGIILISAPSQSRLLLHTQGGVKVSGTENKVKFSIEEPHRRTWLLCRFDTIFPCGTCQKSSFKDHFLSIASF